MMLIFGDSSYSTSRRHPRFVYPRAGTRVEFDHLQSTFYRSERRLGSWNLAKKGQRVERLYATTLFFHPCSRLQLRCPAALPFAPCLLRADALSPRPCCGARQSRLRSGSRLISAPRGAPPLVRGQLSELCAVFYRNKSTGFSLTWGFVFRERFDPSRRGKSGEKTSHNSSS